MASQNISHRTNLSKIPQILYDTSIDTRCSINVQSKASMSQLNLPHEPKTKKWKTEKLKSKKRICSEVSVKGGLRWEGFAEKRF